MMNIRWILLLSLVLGVGGCAGLQQFPEVSKSAEADLAVRDPDYLRVQTRIEEAQGNLEKQKQIRNNEIDRRLRIIDLNFQSFQAKLTKENVQADFGVAVVQIGVGAAGALVSETASQILSATSAGLAGVQAAYGKAALFNQALPALLAQMIASRKAILVLISEGETRSLDEYPFSSAMRDLDAYYFAGSLPGAIVATSADAQVKNSAAEIEIKARRDKAFVERSKQERISKLLDAIDKLDPKKAIDLVNKPTVADIEVEKLLKLRDPKERRSTDGTVAKELLKMQVTMTSNRSVEALEAWEAAFRVSGSGN